MVTKPRTLALAAALALTGLAGAAHGTDGTPAPQSGPPTSTLDMTIRARALGLTDPMPLTPPSIEFEAQRAPTGAGTSRWPSARSDLGKGITIEMAPICIPGVDEPYFPPRARNRR
jgi:hypothetical protein